MKKAQYDWLIDHIDTYPMFEVDPDRHGICRECEQLTEHPLVTLCTQCDSTTPTG